MKVSFFSTGLMSAALVTFTFLSLSKAWPHNQHYHHGPAHQVHPDHSAGSGSGLIYNSVGGNTTHDETYRILSKSDS